MADQGIAARLRKHAQIHDDNGNPGAAFACRSGADELRSQHAEIQRLTAELEVARKDAERYRWLREPFSTYDTADYYREDFDAQVDKAMREEAAMKGARHG